MDSLFGWANPLLKKWFLLLIQCIVKTQDSYSNCVYVLFVLNVVLLAMMGQKIMYLKNSELPLFPKKNTSPPWHAHVTVSSHELVGNLPTAPCRSRLSQVSLNWVQGQWLSTAPSLWFWRWSAPICWPNTWNVWPSRVKELVSITCNNPYLFWDCLMCSFGCQGSYYVIRFIHVVCPIIRG